MVGTEGTADDVNRAERHLTALDAMIDGSAADVASGCQTGARAKAARQVRKSDSRGQCEAK